MTIRFQLASKDGLPDGLPAEFLKTEGNATFLELPEGWGVDNVAGLRKKNSELLGEVRELKSKLAPFNDLDPQDLRGKLERLNQLEAQPQGGGAKAVEEARKQLEAQYRKELDTLKAETQTLREDRKRSLLAQAEAAALRESKHKPLPGLEYLMRERMRVEEIDGALSVVVVDEAGKPRVTTKPGGSGYMTPEELIEEFARNERYGHLFQGTGKAGSQVTGRAGSAAVSNPWAKGSLNVTKQLELMATNPSLAAELQARAAAGG